MCGLVKWLSHPRTSINVGLYIYFPLSVLYLYLSSVNLPSDLLHPAFLFFYFIFFYRANVECRKVARIRVFFFFLKFWTCAWLARLPVFVRTIMFRVARLHPNPRPFAANNLRCRFPPWGKWPCTYFRILPQLTIFCASTISIFPSPDTQPTFHTHCRWECNANPPSAWIRLIVHSVRSYCPLLSVRVITPFPRIHALLLQK